MDTLPQELVHEIARYFSSDNATLRCCALISKPWLYATRCQLFTSMTLDVHEGQTGSRTIAGWKQLLDAVPEIRGFIRLVTVYGARWEGTVDSLVSEASSVLALLSNVKSLSFTGIQWPRMTDDAEGSCVNLFSAGAASIHSTVTRILLTDVVFNSAQDLFHFLREFTSLTYLEMHFVVWTGNEESDLPLPTLSIEKPAASSSAPRLRYLDLANVSSWNRVVQFLAKNFRLELTSIKIRWEAVNYNHLVLISGRYLKSIEIDFYRTEERNVQDLIHIIGQCSALTSICFKPIWVRSKPLGLSWVYHVLKALPKCIERIDMTFHLDGVNFTELVNWDELDELLVFAFPNLVELHFKLYATRTLISNEAILPRLGEKMVFGVV